MTQLTIGTFSILNKEYNKLTINNINTTTGVTSSTTTINFSISEGNNFMNGYRDSLVIVNAPSLVYNDLVSQFLSVTGLVKI